MQLHLRFSQSLAAPHEDAHWGEAFQVQPMQQSLHTKALPCKTSQYLHAQDSGFYLVLKYLTIEITERDINVTI